MKPDFERWGTSIVGGKYLHMRCVAHILNLIVNEGLDEIGMSVRRVREAVKWIKASPSRADKFRGYVEALKIACSKSLTLDVPTRWNSTYLMLESAVPYVEVFNLHVNVVKEFVHDLNQKKYKDMTIGVPDSNDWAKVRMICDYLGRFYDLTLLVSGTTYVSAHLFFKEMCSIFEFITQLQRDTDTEIRAMANEMKDKLGKYWLETDEMNPRMNKLFHIAALLDPRQKITHVEKCLKKVYAPQRAIELLGEVRNSLNELFEYYKKQLASTDEALANAPTSVQIEPRVSSARSHVDVISDDSEDEDSGDM
ncbi:zinc finger BED domain-containing protein RICESLEEPER 2-like [Salvia miltiorrhiza]|uniref:zinc finger BED domain-containing protein RICESLEEPER 2-like n=1 Tax=Salvia miltiorrhiza TaxID=226208 RepID=UPI0025AB920F|nr:zinc finger BED domain-containing protein RICESLEEPER 2-like [Salvia miltiorrhiza]